MMKTEQKTDAVNVRLPVGTGERIDKVLYGGELRSAFIRAAVEAELQKREVARAKLNKALGVKD